jgi:hypothetical protein
MHVDRAENPRCGAKRSAAARIANKMERKRRVEKEARLREQFEYDMRMRMEAVLVPEPENVTTEEEDAQNWEDLCVG